LRNNTTNSRERQQPHKVVSVPNTLENSLPAAVVCEECVKLSGGFLYFPTIIHCFEYIAAQMTASSLPVVSANMFPSVSTSFPQIFGRVRNLWVNAVKRLNSSGIDHNINNWRTRP
jgi:hypothetical protein